MKEAVPQRVHPQAGNGVHRIDTAEHVVPLEHLMEKDPVEEAAETDPEHDTREFDWKGLFVPWLACFCDGDPSIHSGCVMSGEALAKSPRNAFTAHLSPLISLRVRTPCARSVASVAPFLKSVLQEKGKTT